jgi:hypothetical protein
MHLNRPGELSPVQAEALERHLKRCPACAAVQGAVNKMEGLLATARLEVPHLADPARLAERIDSAVGNARRESADRTFSRAGSARGFLQVIDGLLRHESARPVFAIATVLIAGVFFIQEATVLKRVSRLEKRMAAVPGESPSAVRLSEWNGWSGALPFKTSMRHQAGDEWISVPKEDLEKLLEAYEDARRLNGVLLDAVQKYRPQINGFIRTERLDASEFERALAGHPEWSSRFKSWLNHGGRI